MTNQDTTSARLSCENWHNPKNSKLRKLLEKLDAYAISGGGTAEVRGWTDGCYEPEFVGRTYIKVVIQCEDQEGFMHESEVLGPWATEEKAAEYLQNAFF